MDDLEKGLHVLKKTCLVIIQSFEEHENRQISGLCWYHNRVVQVLLGLFLTASALLFYGTLSSRRNWFGTEKVYIFYHPSTPQKVNAGPRGNYVIRF